MHADARSRSTILGSAALVCVAGCCVPFGSIVLPAGAAQLVPATIFFGALVHLATFAVLLAVFAKTRRRSVAFLAAAFLGTGVIVATQALTMPTGPAGAAVFHVAAQVPAWLYVAWHVAFSLCAVAYFSMRRRAEPKLRSGHARLVALASALALGSAAALAAATLIAAGPRLPYILGGAEWGRFLQSGIGPAVFAVCLLAAVFALARRQSNEIDAALSLSLVALTLDVGLHLVDDRRYVAVWYAARLFALLGSSLVLAAAIRGLLGWRDRALRLESLLADEKRVAEHHARRLQMLWRLGSSTADDEAFLREMLDKASSVIVEGQQLWGLLAHLEGAEMVVDIAAAAGRPGVAQTGGRYPLDESILGVVLGEGKTTSWADIRLDPRFSVRRLQHVPWRSSIGTTFRVAQTIYYIGFAGTEPLAAPFGTLDHAYVETLASFCAARLQQRAHRDHLQYQTEHDALTGVLSRATFRAHGFATMRDAPCAALAIVDVDRFREMNDTIGQLGADAVLIAIARALESCAADGDVVGRLGGDTFGIVMRAGDAKDEIERRVARYFAVFEQPFGAGETRAPQHVTASIGVATAPEDGTAFEQLLARADTAVYAAKAAGGARWLFFDRRLEDAFAQTRRLQNELAEALVRGEFVLHFQPHVEFATGSVVGAEALIRWNHPRRGLLLPSEFVAFAEEHRMMGAIGAWVMSETVRASTAWRIADPGFRVWFNMSATELADPAIFERLRGLGAAVHGVGVELTETVAMQDVHETMRNVAALREAGFEIALDDFGTGYSSLAHLKRLPVDVIKIDRAFTSGVPGDPQDEAIVGAVLEIANRFGFVAIAEGVERADQVDWLAAAGCRYGQGFHFALPMPAHRFDAWLTERRNTRTGRAYMRV